MAKHTPKPKQHLPGFRRELRFEKPTDAGTIHVGINIANGYDKSVAMANSLTVELKRAVPFRFRTRKASRIVVLGPPSRKGMLGVEMEIVASDLTPAEAVGKLEGAGFSQGFEQTLH